MAAVNEVGVVLHHGHLLHGLLADDGLVEEDVVQDAAQGVVGVLAPGGLLHGLADGEAQDPGRVRMDGEHVPPRLRELARARDDLRPEEAHEDAAVRLLREAHLHHVDPQVHLELLARERQGAPPLPRARLRRQAVDAADLVVVGLGYGRVRLVAPRGGNALVLVVDARRGSQRLLEAVGADQGRGAPEGEDLHHGLGDVEEPLGAHLLLEEGPGEDAQHLVGGDGLPRGRTDGGSHGGGHVGEDVVPLLGHVFLRQEYLVHISLLFAPPVSGHLRCQASVSSSSTYPPGTPPARPPRLPSTWPDPGGIRSPLAIPVRSVGP